MNHRANSALHFFSAGYCVLISLVALFIAPRPSYSPLEIGAWMGIGLILIVLDSVAGVKQWRSSVNGRALSIGLHFTVTISVTFLITFEYLQRETESLVDWFRTGNFWFVVALVLLRLWSGVGLLRRW